MANLIVRVTFSDFYIVPRSNVGNLVVPNFSPNNIGSILLTHTATEPGGYPLSYLS